MTIVNEAKNMRKNKINHKSKELCLFFVVMLLIFLNYSCKNKKEEIIVEDCGDCTYQFAEELADIYGAWEPRIVIDYETGDSTYYEIGEGHTGFIFEHRYADAFELRDNNDYSVYYVSDGRYCESRIDGNWSLENSILNIFFGSDTLRILVLSLEREELIIEDIINFKESKAIMRKVN